MDLKKYIRDVPDFPKKGILFKDITPLLQSPKAFPDAIEQMYERAKGKRVDYVVSMEARGFIFGAPLAIRLGAGFVPIRKPGKLPYRVVEESYMKEYGEDKLCMHEDAIKPGSRVLIVDDLLATGGTVEAACRLVERMGGEVVGTLFLIELTFLKGRERLAGYDVEALIKF